MDECDCEESKPQPSSTISPYMQQCDLAIREQITLNIHPVTGGPFTLQVLPSHSVHRLQKIIAKKLKVPKEKICLLYRERHLRDGSIASNSLMDGCKISLLPSVETGFLAQRPEQSVINALENLSDSQVDDFLGGKAPLNLTVRLGEEMMVIQLGLQFSPQSSKKPKPPVPQNHTAVTTSVPCASRSIASDAASCECGTICCGHNPCSKECENEVRNILDTKALAEVSNNLKKTLKQLSSEVLASKSEAKAAARDTSCAAKRQGAIIESMHHHGRGVYSGTFSGTLNPALKDKDGRPKRNIGTIIHILNDLMCATPGSKGQESGKNICGFTRKVPEQLKQISDTPHPCTSQASTSTEPQQETDEVDPDKAKEEHERIRDKVEQLRLIMSQRRERRKANRERMASPYLHPESGAKL